MRLIDADAYSSEMKDRQEAAWKWRNEAIAEEDEVKLARVEGAYAAFTEAKLTMDKHIINPWHRVEEELPEKEGDYLVWTMLYGGHAYTDYYTPKYGWDEYKVIAWMPLPEPPKEDA